MGGPSAPFILPEEEVRKSLDVPGTPPPSQRRIGSPCEVHPETVGGISSPERGSVPISPEHRSRGVVCEVLLRLDLACDRGMTAVGSHNEACPERVLLTRRPAGSHADHAVFVSHE
jgi:hypothetical protein